ncbi:unnamed protein product [Chrysodeixis includens]|uniref:Uncharacterized protein n=1 Tax=Chrysodeixis includens TaxID=689277 RepID=A0A9P0FXI7_CHRIL|nr:unnamed protein product [Chrysodeixis includens]
MSHLKVCRICLRTKAKMYHFTLHQLRNYYEEVTDLKMDKDGLPKYFCFECTAMLCKYHKFKEKCLTAQRELKKLLWSGPISSSSLSLIDRVSKNLTSSIGVVEKSKRVKTYNVKDKTEKPPETEENKVDYDSDTSMDDKNLSEIKNESKSDDKINVDENNKSIKEEIPSMVVFSAEINSESFAGYKTETQDEESDHQMLDTEIQSNTEQISESDDKEKKNKRKKKKKFEVDADKIDLDPNHWVKINLNEEEALFEFKARAQDSKYLAATYKCEFCFKWFSKEDIMRRHLKLRHNESAGPNDCPFCHMRYRLKNMLSRHIVQHYTKYKCLRCDLVCPLKNTALFHNDYHNGVIRKCKHCGVEFRHVSTYYTHLRAHRSEHVCTLCGACFVSVKGLSMHKKIKHVDTVTHPEEEQSYCERCDIRFETQRAYEEHLSHSAMHAEGVDDTPAQSTSKHTMKSLTKYPRKAIECPLCNKTFSTQTAYKKHIETEHKDSPIVRDEQRHVCEICGASLAANSVASHMNTHTREKIYTCGTCGMQFNSKSSANRHKLTHTGEKPYGCSLCDKRFTQKGSMQLHYRTFHLKEPYPKRNRTKKGESSDETSLLDYYRNERDSKKNLKVNRWR